jgi:hypothetical protein
MNEMIKEIMTTKENVKVYGGLLLSPYFEDSEYWYYPCANGSVWVESKHGNYGYSATAASNEASSVRNKTLDRWFALAD